MKTHTNNLPVDKVFWPMNVNVPNGDSSHDKYISDMVKVAVNLAGIRLTPATKAEYSRAARWFVFGIYQAHISIPSVALAIPLGWGAYSETSIYKMKHGIKTLLNLITAGKKLGYLSVVLGQFNPLGKGRITRIRPSGYLLSHFNRQGFFWSYLKPTSKNLSIFLNQKKHGKERIVVERHNSLLIPSMQDNLYRINDYLSYQCIGMYVTNTELLSQSFWRKKEHFDPEDELIFDDERTCSKNFQQVFFHRVFVQNSLELGGRFYGPFWQSIPSELRRRIIINGDRTVECDFSGLMFAMLYARVGLPLPHDPYNVPAITDTKEKRDLVKRLAIVLINSKSGKYRLPQSELLQLGISQEELVELLRKKHQPIQKYFGSGVGVELQYEDSQLAEKIMLRLISLDQPCLSIHDSFVVRLSQHELLKKTMQEVFFNAYGQTIGIKSFIGCEIPALDNQTNAVNINSLGCDGNVPEHPNDEHSIIRGYIQTWRDAGAFYIPVEKQVHTRHSTGHSDDWMSYVSFGTPLTRPQTIQTAAF
jgi:hypothetical protein